MNQLPDVQIIQARPNLAVVEFVGEHDLTSKDAVNELLTSLVTANERVVVDLSGATFIDSSVINALLVANRLAKHRGTSLTLQLGEGLMVRSALTHSGALTIIPHVSSREEAMGDR